MELAIALRFIQGWWLEPKLKEYLPEWAKIMHIPKPTGVIDCRLKEPKRINFFMQQLRNPQFPWILFPSKYAGPDLRYSIFSCYVKTTSTPNSKSSMFVSAEECRKNLDTMNPYTWYNSQSSLQKRWKKEIDNLRFIHMRFELPYTAPSMKESFRSGPIGNGHIFCIDLDTDIAKDFFGETFVGKYKNYISGLMQ